MVHRSAPLLMPLCVHVLQHHLGHSQVHTGRLLLYVDQFRHQCHRCCPCLCQRAPLPAATVLPGGIVDNMIISAVSAQQNNAQAHLHAARNTMSSCCVYLLCCHSNCTGYCCMWHSTSRIVAKPCIDTMWTVWPQPHHVTLDYHPSCSKGT